MWTWECVVCIDEGENLPIYTFHVIDQIHDWGWLVSLTELTSPRETLNTHYMMLHWGIFPRIIMEVVTQGLDTLKTSHNVTPRFWPCCIRCTWCIHCKWSWCGAKGQGPTIDRLCYVLGFKIVADGISGHAAYIKLSSCKYASIIN